jgi:hypothetical protein
MSETSQVVDYAPPLPPAVRRQAEEAERLAREASAQARGEELPQNDSDQTNTTVVEPEQQTTLPFAEPPQPVQQPSPPSPDWEARYQTLQGKYNTEMAELRGQVRSLQDILATSQQQREQPREQPTHTGTTVPAADVDAYGQDLIDGVNRWVDARYATRIAELERRVGAAEQNGQSIRQLELHSAATSVEASLDRALPEWRSINVDPNFVAWLATEDPFSGQRRQDMITRAYESGNAARTLAFFQAYQREHTAVSPSPTILPTQTAPAADRLPLADLAVPGRAPTAAPPAPGAPSKRIWTTSEISAFYRQAQRGAYRDRPEEYARIEADIIAAPLEGRVRQS